MPGLKTPSILLIIPKETILLVRMGYEFAKGETTVKSIVKGDSFEEVENRLKNLMGYDDEARGRFIGHGLGLELDEPPHPWSCR